MRGILIKSAAALVLCAAPAIALAQTEVPKKKLPVPTEGTTQSPPEGQAAPLDGTTTGQSAPSGEATGEPSSKGTGTTDGTNAEGAQGQSTGQQTQPQSQEPQDGESGQQDDTTANPGNEPGAAPTEQGGTTTEQPAEVQPKGTTPTQDLSGQAGSDVNVTVEQQTEIKQVITEAKVEPVPRVDFSLDVGVAVPETITLHPLPPRIIELVPAYEGYLYFVLADGRIIIVDPNSHEIVLIIT